MSMKAFVVETSRSGPIEERVSRRAIASLSRRLIFAAIGFVLVAVALSACAERRPDETFTIGAMDIRVIDPSRTAHARRSQWSCPRCHYVGG